MKRSISLVAVVACLLSGALAPSRAAAADRPDANAAEMGGGQHKKTKVSGRVRRAFVKEYKAPDADQRAVFSKYLPTMGADAILDYLEKTHPLCHGEAHPLGSALFAYTQDLGASIVTCGQRCTGACMHGVIREAFKGKTLEDVTGQLEEFCHTAPMLVHKPGNCAHALGHALMIVSGRDVAKSLSACATYSDPGKAYYCATGVYMEYFISPPAPPADNLSAHYPCDTFPLYPAACYRYQGPRMLDAMNDDEEWLARECLKLTGARRLGCFHGLGAALMDRVASEPAALASGCRHGSADDQTMCIEGVIEKLADYKESVAAKACAKLDGARLAVCRAAMEGKMYRLDKPTLPLYTTRDQGADSTSR